MKFFGKYVSEMVASHGCDKMEVYIAANFVFTNLFSSHVGSYFLRENAMEKIVRPEIMAFGALKAL